MSAPDLTAIALAGVGASPDAALTSGAPVDELALPGADRGHDLLLRAGAAALYRQAGRIATHDVAALEPAPAEARPICSPEVATLIGSTLSNANYDDLLPEAFARMARKGVILPPSLVALALHGVPYSARPALLPLIGERGRWLARHNPQWAWAAVSATDGATDGATLPPDAEAIWQEGSKEQRIAVLAQMRASDPARAREWLSAVWKKEGVKIRETMLETFWQGLAPDDEEFLELVLNTPSDRAADARNIAALMLATLPGSALAGRMLARADATLTFNGNALDAKPPTRPDEQWARDMGQPRGFAEEDSKKKGQRAEWLRQLIERVPPAHWTERFSKSPVELIAASAESKWRMDILMGWTSATERFQDRAWAEALWDIWLTIPSKELGYADRETELTLIEPLLPPAMVEATALSMIENPTRYEGLTLDEALEWLPTPWNATISRAYLDGLRAFVASLQPKSQNVEPWDDTLQHATLALPEEFFAEAREPLEVPEAGHWQMTRFNNMLNTFADKIQMRERIKKVIEA